MPATAIYDDGIVLSGHLGYVDFGFHPAFIQDFAKLLFSDNGANWQGCKIELFFLRKHQGWLRDAQPRRDARLQCFFARFRRLPISIASQITKKIASSQ